MNARDEVVQWLRDAYAMERGLETTLKKQSRSEHARPEVRRAAEKHLAETQRHAEIVSGLLKSLGSDTSSIKTGMGVMTETMKGMGTKMAGDEPVKDLLSSYASEHFEIACYEALAAGAETAGLSEVASACQKIIKDEEEMAQAIFAALPATVHDYLAEAVHA